MYEMKEALKRAFDGEAISSLAPKTEPFFEKVCKLPLIMINGTSVLTENSIIRDKTSLEYSRIQRFGILSEPIAAIIVFRRIFKGVGLYEAKTEMHDKANKVDVNGFLMWREFNTEPFLNYLSQSDAVTIATNSYNKDSLYHHYLKLMTRHIDDLEGKVLSLQF